MMYNLKKDFFGGSRAGFTTDREIVRPGAQDPAIHTLILSQVVALPTRPNAQNSYWSLHGIHARTGSKCRGRG